MTIDRTPPPDLAQPEDWLLQFAVNAGPRISAKERGMLMGIAGLYTQTNAIRDSLASMLQQFASVISGDPATTLDYGDLLLLAAEHRSRAHGEEQPRTHSLDAEPGEGEDAAGSHDDTH